MKFSDDVYTFLKWLGLIALPAIATFYGVIGKVWDIPHTAEVVTTITAVATLIGALIGVSTVSYNKQKEDNDGQTISKV